MAEPRPIAVFDLDGTLADTAQDLIATLNVVLAADGLPQVPFHRARDLIGAGARPLIERGFALAGHALDEARLETLYRRFLEHYHTHIAVHTVLFDGVREALAALEARGFLLAVCTNKLESHALELLARLGMAERFACIAGKDTFAVFKPEAGHLLETIRTAGGDPARAVMVGDSRTDVDTARAAGVPVVGVTFGYTAVPMQELYPDAVIAHFAELLPAIDRVMAGATA
jgi:phosphoglycolate phosphatase